MGIVPPRFIRPRGYQPSHSEPEQDPPQSVSGSVHWNPALQAYQLEMYRIATYFHEHRSDLDHEAVNAMLAHAKGMRNAAMPTGGQSNRALLTLMKTLENELSPESIDGIEPCGYEEL